MTRTPFVKDQHLVAKDGTKVIVRGAWAMNHEIAVAAVSGSEKVVHIYPTGYCPDLGRDVFLRSELDDRKEWPPNKRVGMENE